MPGVRRQVWGSGALYKVSGVRCQVADSREERGLGAVDCGLSKRGQVKTDHQRQVPVFLPSGHCSLPRVLPQPLGPIAGDEVDYQDQCL